MHPTVCWLSQSKGVLHSGSKQIDLNSRFILMISRPTEVRAMISASVVDKTIVCWSVDCHAIGPLNNFIKKPWVDFRVLSSAELASLAAINRLC